MPSENWTEQYNYSDVWCLENHSLKLQIAWDGWLPWPARLNYIVDCSFEFPELIATFLLEAHSARKCFTSVIREERGWNLVRFTAWRNACDSSSVYIAFLHVKKIMHQRWKIFQKLSLWNEMNFEWGIQDVIFMEKSLTFTTMDRNRVPLISWKLLRLCS